MVNDLNEKIKELTLILLYLTSWEEKILDIKYHRSWKGYDFDILDELADDDLISKEHRSKSVAITDAGINKAKELLKKYKIEDN
ncbi:transposase [Aceticella autotrophica]|uniref:Transposase n=1 Tax=Aceticella autotrophica TaxID=2755338 RepID=A0A975GB70_9THEO|nr:DUF6429 family protein [Aceticella autotrophica]QSZ28015.1 transposase [Aceticella autotrophica]